MNLTRGTQVVYVPYHAGDNLQHPSCEFGFVLGVSSTTNEYTLQPYADVRYWRGTTNELRTRANSERTPLDRLFEPLPFQKRPQWMIDLLIERIESGQPPDLY